MKMNKRTIARLMIALLATANLCAETAAEWAGKEKAKLDSITKASLVEIAKGAPDSYRKLFAAVKPDYKSDPVELTRIAALTQIITTAAKPETRSGYADALLEAATGAEAADVACFFLDQLRWCATPKQTEGIRALTKSEKPGVAALAAIAALASESNFASQQKDAKSNPCSEYSAQLEKLQGSKKTKALLAGFDNEDIRIAGIALREAAQLDIQEAIAGMNERQVDSTNKRRHAAGREETKLWCQKLATTTDPIRQTMLLDMLGTRGNPEALKTLAEYVGHADNNVCFAAQHAMLKIDPAAFVKALPEVMKNLPATQADILKNSLLSVPAELIEDELMDDYDTYSMAGKDIVITILGSRRSEKGVTLALAAIQSTAAETAKGGYRLLRDCAGPDEAEILVKNLMKERHSRAGMVQDAVAGAAQRDTSGKYVELLEEAWPKANQEQKLSLLGTFGRIGDKKFLGFAEEAAQDKDEEISTQAVRALSTWNGLDSVKTLLKIAYASPDNKHRVLAQRGIEKILGAKGVNKAEWKTEWEKIKSGAGNDEMKKKLDEFFAK